MKYKEAVEYFNELRQEDANSWGVYFLGTQVYMGKTRVYSTENTARARIVRELSWNSDKEQIKKVVKRLEDSGMLEIRKVGDRSPKFPRNVKSVESDQAERLENMLDATDQEMVKLAVVILEGLNKKK